MNSFKKFNNILELQTWDDATTSSDSFSTFDTTLEVRQTWNDAATKMLLSVVACNEDKVGKTFELKNKAKLWQKAANQLNNAGFTFTVNQVSNTIRFHFIKLSNLRFIG